MICGGTINIIKNCKTIFDNSVEVTADVRCYDITTILLELCEKEGYIERFYIDSPNDKVDITIRDM